MIDHRLRRIGRPQLGQWNPALFSIAHYVVINSWSRHNRSLFVARASRLRSTSPFIGYVL
jgi:hypothetical protein